MSDHNKPGPTGPDELWQEGDHYHTPIGQCVDLTKEQADQLNEHIADYKQKAQAAELSRQNYDYSRPCQKCRCSFPADLLYRGENSECAIAHGISEHMDRFCRNCGYVWAENLP